MATNGTGMDFGGGIFTVDVVIFTDEDSLRGTTISFLKGVEAALLPEDAGEGMTVIVTWLLALSLIPVDFFKYVDGGLSRRSIRGSREISRSPWLC